MKSKRQRHSISVVLATILLFGGICGSAAAKPRVHAVFAFDPHVAGTREDCDSMNTILQATGAEAGDIRVHRIELAKSGDQRQRVLSALDRLSPSSDDVLVFYYSGHGAVDERTRKHVFSLDGTVNGILTRDDVKTQMNAKRCRLKVLISDCCSSYARIPGDGQVVPPHSADLRRNAADLFQKAKGFCDITSSAHGELSWGEGGRGGLFTESLLAAARRPDLDTNRNGIVEWAEAFQRTKQITSARFKEFKEEAISRGNMDAGSLEKLRRQQNQTATAFSQLPGQNPPPPRQGLLVVRVESGTSAERIMNQGRRFKLDPGDVITRVNGREVRTIRDYDEAVAGVERGGTMKIDIVSNGRVFSDVEVQLDLHPRFRLGAHLKGRRE